MLKVVCRFGYDASVKDVKELFATFSILTLLPPYGKSVPIRKFIYYPSHPSPLLSINTLRK